MCLHCFVDLVMKIVAQPFMQLLRLHFSWRQTDVTLSKLVAKHHVVGHVPLRALISYLINSNHCNFAKIFHRKYGRMVGDVVSDKFRS